MPTYIQNNQWAQFRDVIDNFNDDAFNQPVQWLHTVNTLSEFGEDNNVVHETIELKGLIWYNDYRSWPTSIPKPSGIVDGQSVVLYLNIKYLYTNFPTKLNADNFLKLDIGNDVFIINGQRYKAAGESQTAQASDKPLILFIILKREESTTSQDKY